MDKTSKYYPGSPAWAADLTDRVVRRVAELPNTAMVQEAMLVTADDLRKIIGEESARFTGTIKPMARAVCADRLSLKTGDLVIVRRDNGRLEARKVTSEPWQLGHGAWVISLEGISGGYDLERCDRAPTM